MFSGSVRREKAHRVPKRRLRPYTTLTCPMAGHRVTWCRGLCQPIDGRGVCGRLAPHALGRGRTQQAIAEYLEREEERLKEAADEP